MVKVTFYQDQHVQLEQILKMWITTRTQYPWNDPGLYVVTKRFGAWDTADLPNFLAKSHPASWDTSFLQGSRLAMGDSGLALRSAFSPIKIQGVFGQKDVISGIQHSLMFSNEFRHPISNATKNRSVLGYDSWLMREYSGSPSNEWMTGTHVNQCMAHLNRHLLVIQSSGQTSSPSTNTLMEKLSQMQVMDSVGNSPVLNVWTKHIFPTAKSPTIVKFNVWAAMLLLRIYTRKCRIRY